MILGIARSAGVRIVAAFVAWLAATEASEQALGYAVVAVPLVVIFSYVLTGPPRSGGERESGSSRRGSAAVLRVVAAVLGMCVWVLWRSMLGALDVSRRVLSPRGGGVDPEWKQYEIGLRTTAARVACALIMNLMPGTLTAHLEGDRLDVHVISPDLDTDGSLASLTRWLRRIEPQSA